MMPAAEVTPSAPNGAKSDRLSESQPVAPTRMNRIRTATLISTITALTLADSLAPRMSSSVQRMIRTTAGVLNTPPCSGAFGERLRDLEPEQVVEQLVEVLRPADGDRGRRDAVLQQQAGRDHHGDALAHGRVGVGVRRARHRHGAGQLGVADGREARDRAGEDEREDDGRPGDRHGLGEDDEDAGADRRADPEERELEEPDRARQLAARPCPSRSPRSSARSASCAGPARAGTRVPVAALESMPSPLPLLRGSDVRGRADPPRSRAAPPPRPPRRPRTPRGSAGAPL